MTYEPVQHSPAAGRLNGKVAVVTGASTGIGAATARMLAAQGAAVVLAARRADKLAELADEITGNGGQAAAQPADTTSASDLARMVDRAVTEFGHLDWAVNNAGASARGAFLEIPVEDFDAAVAVNLRGVMLAMRAEIPAMLDNRGGAIVNVGLEFATRNIRVNAIAPGGTNTEMLASGTQEQRDYLASLSPMKRVSEPAEIAAGIVYLLADATFSTAITLSADGGQSAA
jgi:NAD(P)-dependent dehydrogenase (short-subunit alcohol dehydrogenase family)